MPPTYRLILKIMFIVLTICWVWSHQGLAFLAFLARAYKDAQSPKMDCFFQQTIPLLYTFLEKLEFSYEICHSISHPD